MNISYINKAMVEYSHGKGGPDFRSGYKLNVAIKLKSGDSVSYDIGNLTPNNSKATHITSITEKGRSYLAFLLKNSYIGCKMKRKSLLFEIDRVVYLCQDLHAKNGNVILHYG